MAATTPTSQQGRSLLNLPAELWDDIYELVRPELMETLVIIGGGEPKFSDLQYPLSRTCRQLRQECRPFVLRAAENCKDITLLCKVLDMPPQEKMIRFLHALPPWPGSVFCFYTQRIVVDDIDFEDHLERKMQNFLIDFESRPVSSRGRRIICDVTVNFDTSILSLDSLKRAARVLSNCALDEGQISVLAGLRVAIGNY